MYSSTTGKSKDIENHQVEYFERLQKLNLSVPQLIGFGIHDKSSFDKVSEYANSAIIGSAFIKHLENNTENLSSSVDDFISSIG